MIAKQKKQRGRPSKLVRPEPIPDTEANILRSLFQVRTKAERDAINREADKAEHS